MTLSPRVLLCAVLLLPALSHLAGCAAPAPAPGGALGKVEADVEAQKKKQVATRLQAGIEALKSRDPERARRHITRALEIDPDSAEAHNAMGLLYRYEGDDKREEEHFRRALREDGNFSQARNNYAALLFRQGRYEDAIEQLEKAADDTSYDSRALAFLNLGRCYIKTGELDKAANALQRSLRLDSEQADARLELAEAYLLQQKYTDARSYLAAYTGRARHTARSLWLGVRIETALGDVDKVSSYEFQLGKMFRDTPEYRAWQAWKNGGAVEGATDKRKKR